ncbi:group-specific protein [Fictibacillus enclensis]|uniref:group-specific protein n=1 Tax=Fictibacillus enclensis TaxID=1017270 RepID=UPI0024BFC135|nr:group-specific protein [Fictibacillus enclensis]WHY71279.1 group-specific protein [Fictibacillus enclensis]
MSNQSVQIESAPKLIEVQVDEEAIKRMYHEAIERRIEKLENELVYWDSNELKRRTCMSWNTILNNFFFEKDFPKIKVGGKWYFPATETKKFLTQWLYQLK